MSFDNAYESITEDGDDRHWAFGTGFDDPLSGVDHALPSRRGRRRTWPPTA